MRLATREHCIDHHQRKEHEEEEEAESLVESVDESGHGLPPDPLYSDMRVCQERMKLFYSGILISDIDNAGITCWTIPAFFVQTQTQKRPNLSVEPLRVPILDRPHEHLPVCDPLANVTNLFD